MKKVFIGLLIIIVILGGMFYQQILDTKDFYHFQRDNAVAFREATISWKTMSFSSSDYSAVANKPLIFDSLSLPVPFANASKENAGDYAQAQAGNKIITIGADVVMVGFFAINGFSETEEKEACQFLSLTSGIGACTSNHNLYRAFLELNETDIHLFSSIPDKELYNRLMTIRATNLESNTISAFETSRIKGFLFIQDNQTNIAYIFDQNDDMYTLNFTSLDKAEVAFVLSNISYVK